MSVAAERVLTSPYQDRENAWLTYDPIRVGQATFLSGLSQRLHRWFRLTPSFGPDLVQTMLTRMNVVDGSHVHDPFSGAGTTAIEASLEGFRATCVEINPFLHFVNRVCLDWRIDEQELRDELGRISAVFQGHAGATFESLAAFGFEKPPIHNVSRWWRSDVLLDLLKLKLAISTCTNPRVRDFFHLALAAVLVPDLTNVTLGRLQLHFIDKSGAEMDVWTTFSAHTLSMIADVEGLHQVNAASGAEVIFGDSTKAATFASVPEIDAVVTSPPYPNRYSYVWNTRPHLYMLDFIVTGKQATDIDRATIGGTWGTATSELSKGVWQPQPEVEAALQGCDKRIASMDQLMANYVVHYFNRLADHLRAIEPRLSKSAKLAYVVGNSTIKGEYVATDMILGRLMESVLAGTQTTEVHRFRKRHSGIDLYESIVYAERLPS